MGNQQEAFAGSKVWALHAFQRRTPKIAREASRGTLLVDTGACCSVCTAEACQTADFDPSATKELYIVDDTPQKVCGEFRHKVRLREQFQEEAQVTFQVVQGVNENLSVNRALDVGASAHFEIDNCYIQWAGGSIATFRRKGRQFLLPYVLLPHEKLDGGKGRVKIAAIDPEDKEKIAVHRHAFQKDAESDAVRECYRNRTNSLEEQRQQHRLTHLPFQPWCAEGVSGKSRQDQYKQDQSTERD